MAKQTFEQMLAELDEIVRQLESGTPELETSLKQYEKGVALLRGCRQVLSRAQRKIEVLMEIGPDGEAQTADLEDAELTDEQKAQSRSSRRGYKGTSENAAEQKSAPSDSAPSDSAPSNSAPSNSAPSDSAPSDSASSNQDNTLF